MTPTPPRRGLRWRTRKCAARTMSSGSRASTAPSSRHTASKTSKAPARLAVCERADRTPASVRPVFTTSTGLPAAAGGGEAPAEARAVQQALHVEADGLGARVLDQVLEEVADLQVHLIAHGDAVAEADAVGAGPVEDRDHQGAALAHQPDGPVAEPVGVEHHRRAEGQAMMGDDEPHAVGPHQADAGLPHDLHQRRLARAAFLARLREAGGDDDAASDAGRRGLGHAAHQGLGGHREDGDVHVGAGAAPISG